MKAPTPARRLFLVPLALCAVFAGGAVARVQDVCGPFTDVSPALCPYVLEMYYLGITAGTSSTTYSPDAAMTRGQAAVFVSKGVNQAIARSSRRAALARWGTTRDPHWTEGLNVTPFFLSGSCTSDGTDVWVGGESYVYRVRGSDGKLLDTWTATSFSDPLVAMGRVFVTGQGTLWAIDPSQPVGTPTAVATDLPPAREPAWLAFDGSRVWVASTTGGVSIVTPSATIPWSVTTLTEGFASLSGIVFDGSNIWVGSWFGSVSKLDPQGTVVQTVPVGGSVNNPVFDGANLWIPTRNSDSHAVSILRASDGVVVATLPLRAPRRIAFDGERMLVLQDATENPHVVGGFTVYRAADLAELASNSAPYPPGTGGGGACSDGLNFWVAIGGVGLGRLE